MNNKCPFSDAARISPYGRRTEPLNYYSAIRLLRDLDYLCDGEICEKAIYPCAVDAAGDICTSGFDKAVELFLAYENEQDEENTYDLLTQIYARIETDVPIEIRAFAAVPEAWELFAKMTADETEILRDLMNNAEPGEDDDSFCGDGDD